MARSAGSISPMEIRYPPATRTVRYIMPWKNRVPAWNFPMAR